MDVPIYQLRVSLKWSLPEIWRRFSVPGDVSLPDLHLILQVVMGWENCHLHEFEAGDKRYICSEMEDEIGDPDRELVEDGYRLSDIAPKQGSVFEYTYDFGDGWQHHVEVEQISERLPRPKQVLLLAGENACPPEDCGGLGGYAEMLETLAKKGGRARLELVDWLGGEWDAKHFDLAAFNAKLVRLGAPKQS